jgi:hypothetical protein
LGKDGVFVDLTVILCAISATTRSTIGAAGNGLGTTIKYLRGATGICLGTKINFLRRATSAAANSGLGTTTKYLVNRNAGAGNNWANAHIHISLARVQMNTPVL